MRKRKWMRTLAAAAADLLSLSACSGSGQETEAAAGADTSAAAAVEDTTKAEEATESGEKKTLTIWVEKLFSDEVNAATEERVQQFAEETGIEVKCEIINSTDFVPRLNAAIEGGNAPDVTYTDTTRTMNYYPNIPYLDVSDLVDEIHEERGYFESMYTSTQIDGVHYYVPYCSSAVIMYVRKDVLEEHGITDMPQTWDEVVEVARQVTDPENDFYGLAMGCGDNDDDDDNTWRQWKWNEGAYMYNEDGTIAITDGNLWAQQLDMIGGLYEEGIYPPDCTTWDAGGNNTAYIQGRAAICINGPSLYVSLRDDEENKEIFENTAIVAAPVGTENGIYMNYPRGYGITKTSLYPEDAADLIRYLLDADWYNECFEITAPFLSPCFEDSVVSDVWDEEVNALIVDYARNASGYYGYPVNTLEGRAVASKHFFTYPACRMVNQVMTGTATGEEAVEEAVRDIEDIQDTVH